MKPNEVKGEKQAAKEADRHNITGPAADGPKWARSLTTTRVADLFKTLPGLPGHWTELQGEINRGNKHFVVGSKTTDAGKTLIKFIADAVVKAAENAKFDFPLQQLKFTGDMSWLKLERKNGKVSVKSQP